MNADKQAMVLDIEGIKTMWCTASLKIGKEEARKVTEEIIYDGVNDEIDFITDVLENSNQINEQERDKLIKEIMEKPQSTSNKIYPADVLVPPLSVNTIRELWLTHFLNDKEGLKEAIRFIMKEKIKFCFDYLSNSITEEGIKEHIEKTFNTQPETD